MNNPLASSAVYIWNFETFWAQFGIFIHNLRVDKIDNSILIRTKNLVHNSFLIQFFSGWAKKTYLYSLLFQNYRQMSLNRFFSYINAIKESIPMKYLTCLNFSKDNKYSLTKASLFYIAWVQEVNMLDIEKIVQLQQYNDNASSTRAYQLQMFWLFEKRTTSCLITWQILDKLAFEAW